MNTFLRFLFCLTALSGHGAEMQRIVARLETLYREEIPLLELKQVTPQDGLGIIRAHWERAHPKETFPVVWGDHAETASRVELMTLNLQNIPYIEAVKYVASFGLRHLEQREGLLVMLPAVGHGKDDWSVVVHPITPQVLTGLGIKKDSPSDKIVAAFRQFGVSWEDWMKIGLYPDGTQIVIAAPEEQRSQVAGIILLLRSGFKITN